MQPSVQIREKKEQPSCDSRIEKFKRAQVYQQRYWDQQWKENPDRQKQAGANWTRYIDFLNSRGFVTADARILDVGCGPCGMINFLGAGQRFGLDTLADYYCSKFGMQVDITWVKGSGENLPFGKGMFDVVITTDTIDHADNPEALMYDIYRVLKVNGIVFLAVNTYSGGTNLVKHIHHVLGIDSPAELHSYSFNDVKRLIEKTGFTVLTSWHDVMDLEATTGQSTGRESEFRKTITKAGKIAKSDGAWEGLKYMIAVFTGGRVYQGDSIFLARKQES